MPSSVVWVDIELSWGWVSNDSCHAVGVDLKYYKTTFKDFKIFTGLGLYYLTTSTGGWVAVWLPGGCLKLEIKLSQPQLKLKLSWVELNWGRAWQYRSHFCDYSAGTNGPESNYWLLWSNKAVRMQVLNPSCTLDTTQPDMEKVSILPRTRFISERNFRNEFLKISRSN